MTFIGQRHLAFCCAVLAGTASGLLVRSANGQQQWTQAAAPTSQDLWSVCYGDRYVAVGIGGTILTSPDGQTWTAQQSGTANWLVAVRWDGRQYLAVGDQGIDSDLAGRSHLDQTFLGRAPAQRDCDHPQRLCARQPALCRGGGSRRNRHLDGRDHLDERFSRCAGLAPWNCRGQCSIRSGCGGRGPGWNDPFGALLGCGDQLLLGARVRNNGRPGGYRLWLVCGDSRLRGRGCRWGRAAFIGYGELVGREFLHHRSSLCGGPIFGDAKSARGHDERLESRSARRARSS